MADLWTALALVLVIEGSLWALLPDMMRRAAAQALTMEVQLLRFGGAFVAAIGVVIVWFIRG